MLLVCGLLGATAVGVTAGSGRAAGAAAGSANPDGATAAFAATRLDPNQPRRAWNWIVLHHSATSGGNVASIDRAHRLQKDAQGRPWLGIGYHFVVGNGQPMGDGEVQPTFRWKHQIAGAHSGKRDYNERGIGICLIGNFDQSPPTAQQLTATTRLVEALCQQHEIPPQRIVRHADVQATACPGRLFPWEPRGANPPIDVRPPR
jgi:hypothetical protein